MTQDQRTEFWMRHHRLFFAVVTALVMVVLPFALLSKAIKECWRGLRQTCRNIRWSVSHEWQLSMESYRTALRRNRS